MGIRQFEAGILAELRKVTKLPKLRQKDIMEWSTGSVHRAEGETIAFLPELEIYVSYRIRPGAPMAGQRLAPAKPR